MQEETLELRVERLENTCDALRYHLENTSKQLALVELIVANANITDEDIKYLIADTAETFHTIQKLYNCRRKHKNERIHERTSSPFPGARSKIN